MKLKELDALLQKGKKPEEKKPDEKKAKTKEVLPLVGGDESLDLQPPTAKEEFPISAPEVSSPPAMEPEAEEQPSEPQKEKSPVERIAATITENVKHAMNDALSKIEERVNGLAEALETHKKTTDEKITQMEESKGNIATKTREIEGVANELERRMGAAAKLLQDMKGTRDALEGRVDKAQAATQNTQEETARLREAVDTLEGKMKKSFENVGNATVILEGRIDEVKGKTTEINDQLTRISNNSDKFAAELNSKVTGLEKKFADKLNKIVVGFQTDIAAINKRTDEIQKEIKGLGQRLGSAESKATAVGKKTNALEADMKQKFENAGSAAKALEEKMKKSFENVGNATVILEKTIGEVQEEAKGSLGKLEKRLGVVETDTAEQRRALEDFLRKDLGRSKLLGDILDTIIEELLVEALKAEDYKDYTHEGPPMDEKELLRALSKDPEYVRAKLAKKFFGDLETEELKKRLNEPRNADRKKWVDYTVKLIITRAQEMCQR